MRNTSVTAFEPLPLFLSTFQLSLTTSVGRIPISTAASIVNSRYSLPLPPPLKPVQHPISKCRRQQSPAQEDVNPVADVNERSSHVGASILFIGPHATADISADDNAVFSLPLIADG